MTTDVILTRKFRLHWQNNNRQNQIRLQSFYADYLTKANELIQYIFNLKPGFDLQSTTTFMKLFKNAEKKAYNDLYSKSLDLKSFDNYTRTGLRLKQRTMRMLTNDVYYPIRNHIIRTENINQILIKLLSDSDPAIFLKLLQKGEIRRNSYRSLQSKLKLNCYDENQAMSAVFLKNHLGQIRNLLRDIRPSETIQQIIPSMGYMKQQIKQTFLHSFSNTKRKLYATLILLHLQKKYYKILKSRCINKVRRFSSPYLVPQKDPLSSFIRTIGGLNLQQFKQNYTGFISSLSKTQYIFTDLDSLFDQCWTEEMQFVNNPHYNLYSWFRLPWLKIKLRSLLDNGEHLFIKQSIRKIIRENIPHFLNTKNSNTLSIIKRDLQTLQQNLYHIIPYPALRSFTCSLPSKDQLWNLAETQNSVIFTFKPIYHHQFTFSLHKAKLRKQYSELGHLTFTEIFSMVPTLQLASKGLTLCQPITQSAVPLPSTANNIMGIDLGLKTLATCSIGSETHEIDRKFISFKNLLTTTVDLNTGRFVRISRTMNFGSNIKARLCSLRKTIRNQKSEQDIALKLSRKRFLERQVAHSWINMKNLHLEIIHQTSHKIVAFARARDVRIIKFEDLRWSQHESKKLKGTWLAQNQIAWFHGQIIDHVSQLALRYNIKTVLVNANLSHYRFLKGERKSKIYYCMPDDTGYRKQLDADLNAARNIRMRVQLAS